MADLVDKAEGELAQLVSRATTAVVKAAGQQALRVSVKVSGGVLAAPYKAAAAAWNVASRTINPQEGKVSLKAFGHLSDGKRAAVKLDDQAVSRELERELKRHGVTWAVERHPDGGQMFHIQGKDAEVIQHALGVAAARVDEKIARNAPELQQENEQQPVVEQQPVGNTVSLELEPEQAQQVRQLLEGASSEHEQFVERVHEQGREVWGGEWPEGHEQAAADRSQVAQSTLDRLDTAEQQPARTDAVQPHGTDELREDAPARSSSAATPEHDDAAHQRDEAMTDRGGHTELRDAPAEQPTRVLSPRDQTREKVVKRIDHEVKEKKNEQRQPKTRTKTRASGREATTEAREAARRSRS